MCQLGHASAVTALDACNNSVRTASLQCFGVISKSCNFVTLGQITELSNGPQIDTILYTVLNVSVRSRLYSEKKRAQTSVRK